MTTRLLFKGLNEDGFTCHGGRGRWPLPTRNPDGAWTPGAPLTVSGGLVPYRNGLHLARPADLIYWLGPAIYLVNVPDGVEEVAVYDQIVVRTARLERRLDTWNERTARHFACDCAERVLHLTTDPRPADAIRVARRFADGLASREELAAARDAALPARYAAGEAAWDAARDAALAARYAAGEAAWAAVAGEAARATALGAARAAAGAVEREWQTARLMAYLCGEVRP